MITLDINRTASPPLVSIFILSAAALAYEVLLIRLFSIIHWHHFAFMVISIALLGYGASGSFITVFRRYLLDNFNQVFVINTLLFALSAVGCFMLVQQLPFNTLEILWDKSQWQRLLLSYLLLTLPFFFVANTIALSMMSYQNKIARIYGFDLIGAGTGALSVMLLLQYFPAEQLLIFIASCGIAAGAFFLMTRNSGRRRSIILVYVLAILFIFMIPPQWLELQLSEYKGLTQTLMVKDTGLQSTHNSPVSRIDVVESPLVPFRYAPGLSLQSPSAPPEQLAVFIDGDEMNTIDRVTDKTSLAYFDFMTSALPYHVHPSADRVLVLESATGAQILQASYFDIAEIDAVEADSHLNRLISEEYADYINWHELESSVHIHNISPRGYAASNNRHDIVILGPTGGSSGGSAGVYALSASYDYTVEALQAYLNLLTADGILSITQWTSNPARGNLKLFNTAVHAMKKNGIKMPENNIAWIRSWNTATLLLKNTPLSQTEINDIRHFSLNRNFDLAWLPDIERNEVNKYQLLQEPVYYLTASSVLKQDNNFIDEYKYELAPATDNRPYFNRYFKWSSVKELLQLPGQAGISMIGVGYPTLLVTLAQAFIAAIILIILPLLLTGKSGINRASRPLNVVSYYTAIGLAFLFIELAFIQKFTLILSQPLYAVAVSLCAFLVFSGLGSLYVQQRLANPATADINALLRRAILLIGFITLLYIIVLPKISAPLMALPETLRIISAFLLAAPLAFVMGMPFPLGLASLQRNSQQLIPWAWGINGCASVLSAILAVLLAMEIGFNGIMTAAIVLYFIAMLNNRRILNHGQSTGR